MYLEREITQTLISHRQWFPVIYLGGPRQSGKTTLLRHQFPELPYSNLESPENQFLIYAGDQQAELECGTLLPSQKGVEC